MAGEALRFPRAVPVEPRFAQLLPELVLGLTPEQFAAIAGAGAGTQGAADGRAGPPARPGGQRPGAGDGDRATGCAGRARPASGRWSPTRTARWWWWPGSWPLLELFREGAVAFDQVVALGDLTIRWTGSDEGEVSVDDEFDVGAPAGGGSGEDGLSEPGPSEPGDAAGSSDDGGVDE